jgi:hypothetical protein
VQNVFKRPDFEHFDDGEDDSLTTQLPDARAFHITAIEVDEEVVSLEDDLDTEASSFEIENDEVLDDPPSFDAPLTPITNLPSSSYVSPPTLVPYDDLPIDDGVRGSGFPSGPMLLGVAFLVVMQSAVVLEAINVFRSSETVINRSLSARNCTETAAAPAARVSDRTRMTLRSDQHPDARNPRHLARSRAGRRTSR